MREQFDERHIDCIHYKLIVLRKELAKFFDTTEMIIDNIWRGVMKAEQIVNVTMNYCGKDEPGVLGYYTRKKSELIEGEWVETNEDEQIFGYCDQFGYMTHICYSQSTSLRETWQEFLEFIRDERKLDKFYFDAGGNGRPLYTTTSELERAMRELGLIK